jgi:hypothetical protein
MTSRTRVLLLVFLAGVAGLGALYAQAQKKAAVPFPLGYRKWTHVKTMVIFSKENKLFDRFEGLHNVYVNDLGWPSLQQGKTYPDGSMLAMEVDEIRTFQGAIEPRGRKALYVMKKNSKLYPATGGWGFEVFPGYQGAGSLKDMKECFDCHSSQKRKDYVNSYYVE